MIAAVPESIHSKRSWILARGHAHPGRDCDRRNHALQKAVSSLAHQAPKIYQSLIAKDDFRGGTIQAKDADFHIQRYTRFLWILLRDLLRIVQNSEVNGKSENRPRQFS